MITYSPGHQRPPSIKILREVEDGRHEINADNIIKALRYSAFIQVLSPKGEVLQEIKKVSDCGSFQLTRRGKEHLAINEERGPKLPYNRNAPPQEIAHWLSSFTRLCRNCPKGLEIYQAEGKLRILAMDTNGQIADDEFHRLTEAKVPWHQSS